MLVCFEVLHECEVHYKKVKAKVAKGHENVKVINSAVRHMFSGYILDVAIESGGHLTL